MRIDADIEALQHGEDDPRTITWLDPDGQEWQIIDPTPCCSDYWAVCEECLAAGECEGGGDGRLYASMVWRNTQTGRQLCDHHLRATPCKRCGTMAIHPELADPSLEPLCTNCLALLRRAGQDIEWLIDKLMRERDARPPTT